MKPRVLLVLLAAGCGDRAPERGAEQAPAPGPAPITVTAAGFASLRWLDGRWRGTMPDGKPFFEGYRMADDSTIQTYSYPDSASTTPSDSGTIRLRGDRVTTGSDGSEWAVTELTEGRVHFAPVAGARNDFTWVRTSADAWTATLRTPARDDQPERTVVYPMTRIP